MKRLIFLKLGGSVITDKNRESCAEFERIDAIAQELFRIQKEDPDLSLLIGHGSGSFGHFAAGKHQTRDGVSTPEQWLGFAEVGERARALNQIVIERFVRSGLAAIAFSPCSSIIASDHRIMSWDFAPIQYALDRQVIPVIYGDVIFDQVRGGTILSTEELFYYLASVLHPNKILLAGLEEGVWSDFPVRKNLILEITPQTFGQIAENIQSSFSPDVTGGMRSKVKEMIELVKREQDLEIKIFSALDPANIYAALLEKQIGTLIKNPERTTP